MAPDRIEAMFELFSQGDGSTTRRYNGMGMGLTLVQRCVRLLGGEITVDSRPQQGSEFRVLVPGVVVAATAAAPEELIQAPSTGTVH
jgi:signal transduction histidine kinase